MNLSVSSLLLKEAKALNIDLSKAAERGITEALVKSGAEQWKKENSEALQSSNIHIEKNELLLAWYRQF